MLTPDIRSCRGPCADHADERRLMDASGIVNPVPESERPAWKATARTLVLYIPKGQWRFAIYNDEGIVDGALADVSAEIAPEQAQARLLAKVEEMTEQRYVATWKQDKPHWWAADLIASP
jgi:hypothetical protein